MSRIGKLPVPIPSGVEVTVTGSQVSVRGAQGALQRTVLSLVNVAVADGTVHVTRPSDEREYRAAHGLTRTLIANMVHGVSEGFSITLELVGVGYRAAKQGGDLVISLGYSHPIRYTPPEGIHTEVPAPTQIVISGADREVVGQVAAQIRRLRKPEPYKGKGVLYRGERVRRKAGKSGKAGKVK